MSGLGVVFPCIVLAAGVLAAAFVNQSKASFHAKTVTRSGEFQVPADVDAAFRLFGPVVEADWAEGWSPEVVYPESAILEEGMVFNVKHPGSPDAVWTISHLDTTGHEITYVLVSPGERVGRIKIECAPRGEHRTRVKVAYHFVGLNEAGNQYVEEFTAEKYAARMANWEHAIAYHLHTGKRFHHHE